MVLDSQQKLANISQIQVPLDNMTNSNDNQTEVLTKLTLDDKTDNITEITTIEQLTKNVVVFLKHPITQLTLDIIFILILVILATIIITYINYKMGVFYAMARCCLFCRAKHQVFFKNVIEIPPATQANLDQIWNQMYEGLLPHNVNFSTTEQN